MQIIADSIKKYFLNLQNKNYPNSDTKEICYWLKEYIHSKNSYISYRTVTFRFFLWIQYHNIRLKSLKRKHVLDYISFMQNPAPEWCGTCRSFESSEWRPFKKGLSPGSIYHNIKILRQMYMYFNNIGYLKKNPFYINIKYHNIVKERFIDRSLSKEECMLILDYAKSLPDYSYSEKERKIRIIWILQLLLYTGGRRSETNLSNMSDFTYINKRLWLRVIGKGNKVGDIPVLKSLEDELNKYRAFYNLTPISKRKEDESHIPIIIKSKNNNEYERLNTAHIYYIIKQLCNNLANTIEDEILAKKLRKVSPHWFRHTSATLQVESGIDLHIVQQNLRHSSINTTMQYVHTSKNQQHDETLLKFNLDNTNIVDN